MYYSVCGEDKRSELSQKMHPVGSQIRFYHTIQAVFQKHTQAQNALLSDTSWTVFLVKDL